MYTCIYVYMYMCMHVYMCVYIYVYICICIYIYMYVCVCVHNAHIESYLITLHPPHTHNAPATKGLSIRVGIYSKVRPLTKWPLCI